MTAAVLERTRPATGLRATGKRPKLRVLDQQALRQRARRRNALLVLFVIVLLGFFAVAFVHAELVAGQQDLDAVRSRIAEAEAHKAKVARAVEEASSPQQIVSRAETLGMVRAYQPVYLQAVAPERDIPIIAALAPAASRTVNQIAAPVPGVSTGISADAAVRLPVSDGADPIVAIAAADTVTGNPVTGNPVTPNPATPNPVNAGSASTDTAASPITAATAQSRSVPTQGAASTGSAGGTSVSIAGAAVSSGGGGEGTAASVAGSRAVVGGSAEGNGSG